MANKSLFYSTYFWITWLAIALAGTYVTYEYFPQAVPIINLDISMDRDQALDTARTLATTFNWGPEGYAQAAKFKRDEKTKHFIELEGGGASELISIMEKGLYTPFTWRVRHFKEGDPHETTIIFKPDGTPYGFIETLAEDAPGAALSESHARTLAESAARESWNIDFAQYKLVEHAQETRSRDRVDHTFTYERTDTKVGEAPYRLQLEISGDTFTQLHHSIKVPDGFKRRYEHMRSANNAIAQTASVLSMLLYLILGSIGGLLFLAPRGWIIWRQPLLWAAFVTGLTFLNHFNSWPLYWMYYNTAYSTSGYALQLIVSFVQDFITNFVILALSFTAAETLTRAAFGDKIQLWKLWSKDVANSWQTLGRTLAGYLILGTDFAYVTAFYFIMLKVMGWWSPIDSLYDPDVLATYVPWFSSIAHSVKAGFWEECIFRAVPLACAALLGKRYGKRRWWITGAFIAQALIFGAAHANYPAQPAYARLVELIIPSFVFGGLYLGFGLLPAIISHIVYDIVWFALPLFVSHAPGIIYHQIMVILCALLPLLVVLSSRIWYGSWIMLPSQFFNKKFKPEKETKKHIKPEPITTQPVQGLLLGGRPVTLFSNVIWSISFLILIIINFVDIGYFKGISHGITITTNRLSAIDQARKHFAAPDAQQWTPLTLVGGTIDTKHRFIWKTTDHETYKRYLHSYLIPPLVKVRLAQFEGDIAARQEEYNLLTTGDRIVRAHHIYAEAQPGASLSEQQARALAYKTAIKQYAINKQDLKEVSAVPSQKPDRLDWTFTFQDTTQDLGNGQARIVVGIAGDTVNDVYRDVFVPEQWKRTDAFNQMLYGVVKQASGLLFFVIIAILMLLLIRAHAVQSFDWRSALLFFVLLSTKTLIQLINNWPTFTGSFKTSEPYSTQLFSMLITILLYSFLLAACLATIAGLVSILRPRNRLSNPLSLKLSTSCVITLFAFWGYISYLKSIAGYEPLWPTYAYINALFPAISMALITWTTYITTTLLFLFFAGVFDNLMRTKKDRIIFSIIMLCSCLGFVGMYGISSLSSWLLTGLLFGVIVLRAYWDVFYYDRSLIPLTVGLFYMLQALQQAWYYAWDDVIMGSILTCIVVGAFAIWWSQNIERTLYEI